MVSKNHGLKLLVHHGRLCAAIKHSALSLFLLMSMVAWSAAQAGSTGKLRCIDMPKSEHAVCAHEFNPAAEQTIVLIHGLHGDPVEDWEGQIPYLSRHYHVLSLQLDSFYRFSEVADEGVVNALSLALRQLTQRYASGPVIILAHSMGGVIGLRYAVDYPDKVSKLVLVDVAGVLQRIAFIRSLVSQRKRSEGESEVFNRVLEKLVTKLLFRIDNYSDESTAQPLSQENDPFDLLIKPELLATEALIDEDFSHSIAGLALPVLIVWGENDHIAPLRTGYTLAARLPTTQLLVIPQVGHQPMQDKPDVFNRALEAFFTSDISLYRPDFAYPQEKLPLVDEVVCRGEKGRVFSGYYQRITLNDCDDVVIRNARVGEVVANSSRLTILHSNLGGGAFGLSVTGSEVEITATHIEGDVALIASRSRLDMAAVSMIGHKVSVAGRRRSDLLFSLSTLSSPFHQGPIHGYFTVDSANPL